MRTSLYSCIAALTFTQALAAQSSHAAPPPAPRPRIGYAGTPTPPPPPPQPVIVPVYVYAPNGYSYNGDTYVTYGAPYEVLSDGSVLVNFGYGYERVLRACAPAPSGGVTQSNQSGRDALGRILDPPGIAALKAGSRGQAWGAQPPRNVAACYRADQQGRVEMVTAGARASRP
jgi:hypothetical protein